MQGLADERVAPSAYHVRAGCEVLEEARLVPGHEAQTSVAIAGRRHAVDLHGPGGPRQQRQEGAKGVIALVCEDVIAAGGAPAPGHFLAQQRWHQENGRPSPAQRRAVEGGHQIPGGSREEQPDRELGDRETQDAPHRDGEAREGDHVLMVDGQAGDIEDAGDTRHEVLVVGDRDIGPEGPRGGQEPRQPPARSAQRGDQASQRGPDRDAMGVHDRFWIGAREGGKLRREEAQAVPVGDEEEVVLAEAPGDRERADRVSSTRSVHSVEDSRHGRDCRSSRPKMEEARGPGAATARSPSVSLIVPVAGRTAFTAECLRALLQQDFPAYEVLLVTRDDDDAAVPVVRELLGELRSGVRGRHVVSGLARSCCQKNHNLLAGVREAGPVDILVFADADHVPPPDWLHALVTPLAKGEAPVSTAYHRIDPHEPGLVPSAHAVTVLVLSITQRIRWMGQLWGGSLAITRALFEELSVAELWAHHMVDDVSLAALLCRRRVRPKVVGSVVAATPLGRENLRAWNRWLFRQILFTKFYFPGTWWLLGAGLAGGAGLTATALTLALGLVPARPAAVVAAWACLGGAVIVLVALRRRHLVPEPAWRWVAAGGVVLVSACVAHARSWFARSFTWRDVHYRVDRTGRVIQVHTWRTAKYDKIGSAQ